mmetsp:Transcript_29806/g.54295  ORF Transcript_29806/g.54295 Transcript_29806/m.54295 type:complete len:304 (-) Transcript_29806:52-963(-)
MAPSKRAARLQLSLCRMEGAINSCAQTSGGLLTENCHISPDDAADDNLHGSLNDVDEELWRAKVSSYVVWLQKQLQNCDELGEDETASWSSRVEALSPALERAFERRRVALEPPVEVPMRVDAAGDEAREAAIQTVIAAIDADAEPPPVVSLLPADASSVREEPVAQVDATDSRTGDGGSAPVTGRPAAERAAHPFRRPLSRKPRDDGIDYRDTRAQIENEMVELVQGMKGHASNMLVNLKKDNKDLSEMEDLQQRGLDKVTAQTAKGKKMMRSGQLGFLCTMIMVIISIVVFFMMIPFIIFT